MKNKKTLILGLILLINGCIMMISSKVNDELHLDWYSLFFIFGGIIIIITQKSFSIKSEKKPFGIYKHPDFKKYYDTTQKRNIWVLGYFGGGAVPIAEADILAREYANKYDIPYESVVIDEILKSRRFKGFKYIYSTHEQFADVKATDLENVYEWLSD